MKFQRKPNLKANKLAYLLDWYTEIRAGMDTTMGYKPVPPSEIGWYRELHGLDLDTLDADTIRRLDVVWLKTRPKPVDPKTGKPI